MILVSDFSYTFLSHHAQQATRACVREKKDEWKLWWANVKFHEELFESLWVLFFIFSKSWIFSCRQLLVSDMWSTTSLSALVRLFCTFYTIFVQQTECTRLSTTIHSLRTKSKSTKDSHFITSKRHRVKYNITQKANHFFSHSFSSFWIRRPDDKGVWHSHDACAMCVDGCAQGTRQHHKIVV